MESNYSIKGVKREYFTYRASGSSSSGSGEWAKDRHNGVFPQDFPHLCCNLTRNQGLILKYAIQEFKSCFA